jgi:hypothetical protein
MSSTLPLTFDAGLAEEAVLRHIAGHASERRFRHERNELYALRDDERERGFHRFHDEWFRALDLARPIETALDELPILATACGRCVVTRATSRHDEGADLLVAPDVDGASGRTVLIRLRPDLLATAEHLLGLLRAELLHVADMVDPTFQYEPTLPASHGGPSYEQLLRERYRVLWNTTVAGRLARRGVALPDAPAHAYREFCAAFPMLGESGGNVFTDLFDGERPTHRDLLAFAAAPTARGAELGLVPGGRCPLCRFPTYAPEPEPEELPGEAVTAIQTDFPGWHSRDGLCRQCADLYRAAAMSASAAAQIPGSRA